MSLFIDSLKKSVYGEEPWSHHEVTRERLLAPPQYCFKRGPSSVQVQYGADPDNAVEYTAWDMIYYQDADNVWHKTGGEVSVEGLYYYEGEDVVYYVDFEEESRKYGSAGNWSLLYNNHTLASVGSPGRDSESEHSVSSPESRKSPARARYGTRARSVSRSRSRTRSRSRSSSISRRARSTRSRSRSTSRESTPLTETAAADIRRRRRRSESTRSSSPTKDPASPSSTPRRGRPSPLRVGGSSRARRLGPSTGPGPVAPEQVGSSKRSVPKRSGGRLETLVREARDPPGICVRGPPNALKCYRYTLKSKHSEKFSFVSTTWTWTVSENPTRVGDGRMLVMFSSEQARRQFLETVPVPRTMSVFPVQFGGL